MALACLQATTATSIIQHDTCACLRSLLSGHEPCFTLFGLPAAPCAQIIAGKDKGTVGTIIKVVTSTGKVSVEGVNIRTKHIAPRTENEVGQIKKSEYPIHHSNVQLYSKEKQVASRVGYKVVDGKKVRMNVYTVVGLASACDQVLTCQGIIYMLCAC
eukprot:352454-Chlamydomonas_euryale.AAC.16